MRRMLTCAALAAATALPAMAEGSAARGAYLARIMDCQGCHSGRTATGEIDPAQHLTGGTIGFAIPGLGVFWPPNLTPAGLGDWTDAEIAAAIRTGERPDGRVLAPAMPWTSYGALTDADAADLVAYLRSLPAAGGAAPAPVGDPMAARAPFYTVAAPPAEG